MPPFSRYMIALGALSLAPSLINAQTAPATPTPPAVHQSRDSVPQKTQLSKPTSKKKYWTQMALGFTTSILAHEAGHVAASYAVGATPHFGWDKGRPTVYSGIDAETERHKQFVFSSAGLNVQALIDETILDVPHHQGAAFERGLLAGGIATAYFYATIGRNASNSDISFMARTSNLSKTQASLIYAGLATVHVFRIAHNDHYANFFVRPSLNTESTKVGVAILHK